MSKMPKRYDEVEKAADRISEKVRYPIENFQGLAHALGGEEAELEFQGRKAKVGQARRLLPEGFFPVESREDLIAKISFIEVQRWPERDDHTPGEQRREPPEDAGEPPAIREQGRKGGIPAIAGHGRKQP